MADKGKAVVGLGLIGLVIGGVYLATIRKIVPITLRNLAKPPLIFVATSPRSSFSVNLQVK